MILSEREIELINKVSKCNYKSSDSIAKLSKTEILKLTDLLGNLIGFDVVTGDLDDLGREADSIISKLLVLLERRGEM